MTVTIRHARPDERWKAYEWLCRSDTTPLHLGPPAYPEHPVPTWEEFREDFAEWYFDEAGRARGSVMIIEDDGEEIGFLCYACFHLRPGRAELDIWLAARRHCGRGRGVAALELLVAYLGAAWGVSRFIIRPSEKNTRAIRAYEKAGFVRAADKAGTVDAYLREEYRAAYGAGDYGFEETAVLTRE